MKSSKGRGGKREDKMLRERDITQEKTTDPEKCNLKVKTTSYNLIKDEREFGASTS